MSRFDDIQESLNEAKRLISEIEVFYESAKGDESIKSGPKIKVKQVLNELRSSLDYCANDIADYTGKKGSKVYFPYGRKMNHFDKGCNSSFPGLKSGGANNAIYNQLISIQPFVVKDNWLYDICKLTNDNKHNKLTNYNRVESKEKTLRIGPITLGPRGSATIGTINIGGKILNPQGPVHLSSQMSIDDVRKVIDTDLEVSSTHEWVEFHVDNVSVDVLKVLIKGLNGIDNFMSSIYQILPK